MIEYDRTKFFRRMVMLVSGILILCSCDPIVYPVPEENPIILSCEAQTVTTKIKELASIMPQNPETDKKTMSLETNPRWSMIENDWIAIYCEWTGKPVKKVKIKVTENTSPQERRYKLVLVSRSKNSTLTIIQEGKNKSI